MISPGAAKSMRLFEFFFMLLATLAILLATLAILCLDHEFLETCWCHIKAHVYPGTCPAYINCPAKCYLF